MISLSDIGVIIKHLQTYFNTEFISIFTIFGGVLMCFICLCYTRLMTYL
nr:MAG TPA: hypothetical protein [Caudoviricetes sp.]